MAKATNDLRRRGAWINTEAVDAYRDERLAAAEQLDQEIKALVKTETQSRYQLCLRLGRMRREKLWQVLCKRSFVRYALDVKAANSSREARQWADVADHLPELPAIEAVFASGKAFPSVIRELALAATRETDAELARKAVDMTVEDAVNEVKRLRGEAPTTRISGEVPLETKALLVGVVIADLSERLGRPVSMGEALVHLVELFVSERAERPARTQAAAGANVLPSRPAQTHTGKCANCNAHQRRGPDGWIALSPASAAMIECDAELVDEHGKIVRTIKDSVRRLVYARDGMVCVVPGCGATRGLNFHHEAPAGWRDVGSDPERIMLLCAVHHRQRHEGWLTIEGTASTGRRFYRYGGVELVAKSAATGPTVGAHTGNLGASEVDAFAGSAATSAGAHTGNSGTSDADAVAAAIGAHTGNLSASEADAFAGSVAATGAHTGNLEASEVDAVAAATGAHTGNLEASEFDAAAATAGAHAGNLDTVVEVIANRAGAHTGNSEVDAEAVLVLRALEFTRTEARIAIQRVRARVAAPLAVEELVTHVLRGVRAG